MQKAKEANEPKKATTVSNEQVKVKRPRVTTNMLGQIVLYYRRANRV